MSSGARVHPTSVIEECVELGEGTSVWHFCHVMQGARLGRNVVLGQNGFVGRNVRVGDACRIQNNVSLFEGVELEEEVFVGPSVVFTNVRRPRAAFPRKERFEVTRVCAGASIGANATVICGVTIGRCALVAAGAVVTRSVAAHALVVGSPARRVGWVCACGESLPDSLVCEACGLAWRSAERGLRAREPSS